jgi:uncharacterized protein
MKNMSTNLSKALIYGAAVIVLLLVAAVVIRGREAAERASVSNLDQSLSVRVADNAWERKRGLSGYKLTDLEADGMLFVFPDQEVRHFWMKGMQFPLDVVWIKDGKIVGVDRDIPAPAKGEEPVRMSSQPVSVDMVLELPAGDAQKYGFTAGMVWEIELP